MSQSWIEFWNWITLTCRSERVRGGDWGSWCYREHWWWCRGLTVCHHCPPAHSPHLTGLLYLLWWGRPAHSYHDCSLHALQTRNVIGQYSTCSVNTELWLVNIQYLPDSSLGLEDSGVRSVSRMRPGSVLQLETTGVWTPSTMLSRDSTKCWSSPPLYPGSHVTWTRASSAADTWQSWGGWGAPRGTTWNTQGLQSWALIGQYFVLWY